mgnify:CR=1 FL=1
MTDLTGSRTFLGARARTLPLWQSRGVDLGGGDTSGLTAAEVAQRQALGQTNRTERGSSRPLWAIVRSNVFTRFNALLGSLFVLILVTGSLADGLFGLVLVVNSGIGIVQEYLAKRKLDRLALLNAPTARVVRDGVTVEVATGEVVLDDLVELRIGDQVCADGALVAVDGLEVDESNLTGESDPVPKAVGHEVRSGTAVVAGTGRFVASGVGPDSYAQRIAAEARVYTRTRSEIESSINRLLGYITWIILLALPLGWLWLMQVTLPLWATRAGRRCSSAPPAAWSGWCPRAWCCSPRSPSCSRPSRSPASRCWCRSCPRSRSSPASTSSAWTRPAR